MGIYKICAQCLMDTTAKEIRFDTIGICNFCNYFEKNIKPFFQMIYSGESEFLLKGIIDRIKQSSKTKGVDSVLGISGGTDSSYLALLAYELGLKPLLVHVDTGWNSPESEKNIEIIASKLDFKLEKINVDWEEMKDVQIAFYKASVKNCEIPQDHAIIAALYRKASEIGVNYILSGGNFATESILPPSWGYNALDLRHLKAVHEEYGKKSLRNFPTISFWQRYFYYPYVLKINEVRLLDYVIYNREKAKERLRQELGWIDYGNKHYESILTRFFQGYYLPMKFGIDKRRAHLSSLILSGQITREEALEIIKTPPYPNKKLLDDDMKYIASKLGLSLNEWETILSSPPRRHEDFHSLKLLFAVKDIIVKILGIRKRRYRFK